MKQLAKRGLFVFAVCVLLALCPSSAQEVAEATASPETAVSVSASPPPEVPVDLSTLDATQTQPSASSSSAESPQDEPVKEQPWDYSPYRVLVWIVSDDPHVNGEALEYPLHAYLDRDFAALWRVSIADAPAAVWSAAQREIGAMSFQTITAADPVLAVKRDHPDAVRLRIASNVGDIVKNVYGTRNRIEDVKRRCAAAGNESIDGVAEKLEVVDGDPLAVRDLWADEETEALLVSRGMALTLTEPEAKLVSLPMDDLVLRAVQSYDKIFVARISRDQVPTRISVIELDTLMRHFGPVVTESATYLEDIPAAVGRGLTRAFAPIVRIDNAGTKVVTGLIRAGGLIMDENSPANIRVNDVLEPMTRKNDRNGKPILIGPIDWAFLYVTEPEIAVLQAGRGTPFQVGDQVVRVSAKPVENPQQIEQTLRKSGAGEKLSVEVARGDQSKTLTIDLNKLSTPLQLQYLGFTAGYSRGGVVVASVIPDAPADGQLQVGDVIVSIADAKVSSVHSLGRLIVSNKSGQPVKLSIERKQEGSESVTSREVTIKPSRLSARMREKDRNVVMQYYSGRPGGLQGRKNQRTFRTALKVRPFEESTLIRLHARGNVDFPLIGYEIYGKELNSTKMTFIGRTDWDGRLRLKKSDDTMQLLYVKNGGAVFARLPIVAGLVPIEVADLSGDDMRLQGEAYIRGVQNAIVDLIAIRELLAARIRLRLKKGQMREAEELLFALREQPTSERLADDMGRKQDAFLKQLRNRSPNQKRKIDEMFVTTRELLTKHIGPKIIRELEADIARAKKNGGKLPDESDQDAERADNSGS